VNDAWRQHSRDLLAEGIQIVDLPPAREHPAAIDSAPVRALFETTYFEFLLSIYKVRSKVANAAVPNPQSSDQNISQLSAQYCQFKSWIVETR
jgi:hypothetical protein